MMKIHIHLTIVALLFGGFAFAQPEKSAYTPAQKQQKRETAEMDRHYNEIKPRKSGSNSGPVSGEYNSYGGADNSKMQGINAAEARQNAVIQAYKEKQNKLRKILTEKNIDKSKDNYFRIIDAAIQAGFDRYWAERTFGDEPATFEKYINGSANSFEEYFGAPSKTVIGSGKKQTYSPIIHDTKFGSGHELHPETFSTTKVHHQQNGYRNFESVTTFLKAIIDDGVHDFRNITDTTTQRSYSICRCDYSYGLKYYWQNFEAPEYGAFKSDGKGYWKYPFINLLTKGKTKEAYKQLFATTVNELLASEMFTRDNDKYNNETFAKLTLKKAYQQDAGADYFVTFQVTEDNGAGVFKMNVSKQDVVITDPTVVNNKPTLKGIPLRTGAGSGVQKVKIVNSKLIYPTINETACLNWSWATEEQKKRCGESGWGNFKPKNGDVGEIVADSKHCYTGARIMIVKMGDYYVPVEDDALVFENSDPGQ